MNYEANPSVPKDIKWIPADEVVIRRGGVYTWLEEEIKALKPGGDFLRLEYEKGRENRLKNTTAQARKVAEGLGKKIAQSTLRSPDGAALYLYIQEVPQE